VDLLHSPKTDKSAYEPLEEMMLRGEALSFEVLNIKKSGEEVWVHVDITAVSGEDGKAYRYVVVQSDITALKKSEQELERLALVAKYTDNSVFITDAQRRTEWVNEAFTKSMGYTLAEIVGKDPKDVLGGPASDPQIVETIQENLKLGVSFSADIISYNKAGEKFWVTMDISPVYGSDGNLKRYIAIHRDITSKKEAEANLLQMTEDLYVQNSNLQQFTYIVSHNLRAPVANALGLASLLTKVEKSSSTFDVTLSHLRTNLVRMDTVLRDVNTMLSARERRDVLEIEQVGLSDVIGQALSYLQESLYKLGATVTIDVDKDTMVTANRAYLFSVLYNLLTNAIKFRSPERPLNIEIRHWLDTDGRYVVSFSDNGIGFDAERAGDNVFKFYKRFHRNIGGRGIGLFLVKTYMEAMVGRVEVESQEDAGTRFMLYLP
jgi:PAS domain S-box-containing protein